MHSNEQQHTIEIQSSASEACMESQYVNVIIIIIIIIVIIIIFIFIIIYFNILLSY